MESRHLKAIKSALDQGYRVDPVHGVIYGVSGKLLKPTMCRGHYPTVTFALPDRNVSVPLHKVVAFAVWGAAAFQPGIHVRHLSGDRNDARENNLALGTPTQNAFDKQDHVRSALARAARAAQPRTPPNRVLSDRVVMRIISAVKFDPKGHMPPGCLAEWSAKLGVAKSTLSTAIHRKLAEIKSNPTLPGPRS
jgi:hypothetical protein